MNPEAGQAWFRIAVMIVVLSAAMLFLLQPGTAEFVVSVANLVIGLVFAAVIVVMARQGSR